METEVALQSRAERLVGEMREKSPAFPRLVPVGHVVPLPAE